MDSEERFVSATASRQPGSVEMNFEDELINTTMRAAQDWRIACHVEYPYQRQTTKPRYSKINPYVALANAIILLAARDYRRANCYYRIREVEAFFQSQWFSVLTTLDGKVLIEKLRKERLL